jgi:transposase, IS5 family
VAKCKRVDRKRLRKAKRRQLGFLRRNLSSIEKLSKVVNLTVLGRRQYRDLLVINELYRQQ